MDHFLGPFFLHPETRLHFILCPSFFHILAPTLYQIALIIINLKKCPSVTSIFYIFYIASIFCAQQT